ncbi:fungal-specific transcription factor domain-containing protein [Aspergillus avenaceus]|uniref:Fungal-specific transcription factor domain-containing protein n=1 Tax=Aspergillus avenaceus TaxID=36643 RepID=A0A5N6TM38_ASPAV|nr:fungal-specific transcription factor domain-containing protein [Aspergillus avenaceus]
MYNPCYTCRRRRVQCDQSGPPCKKCQKAEMECYDKRPLRWVKGVAIRGRLQGLSAKDASDASSELPLVPVPVKASALVKKGNAVKSELKLSPSLEAVHVSNLDRNARFYLDYYNDLICRLFIVYDSKENPFRNLISLALDDQVLMKAVLALAARHRANTGCSFENPVEKASTELINVHQDALSYKHQAIQGLARTLDDPEMASRDTTIASIFLLIFLDLLESGSDKWNFHLEGAKRLITNAQLQIEARPGSAQAPGRTIQEIRKFIIRQIHSIETLGAAFVRPKLLSGCTSLDQPDVVLEEPVEQSFLGCPDYLLKAIQCISAYRDAILDLHLHDDATLDTHSQDIAEVLGLIRDFDCYTWALGLPESHESPSRDTHSLSNLSRSYQLGALIYGQRVRDALLNETTSQDERILELIDVINVLREDRNLLKCILWPIFIAGLECREQGYRDFLITSLENFWADTNCLNAVNAAKALQSYWQKIDQEGISPSQWIFNIGDLDHDWLFI